MSRYLRQTLFPGIGESGQQKLLSAHVVIIGCGATGTVIANHLARAGIGQLTIVDRDFIELNNLQRQLLFDEQDLAEQLPKAIAATRKLRRINSEIKVEGIVTDVNAENIETLIGGADLVMDGTDNFETRYLLNDACIKHNIPWIYTGAVSSYGMSQTIIPSETACLRCLIETMPLPGSSATCDTAGVVGSVVGTVASISTTEAIKLLVGDGEINRGIIYVDLWINSFEQFNNSGPRPNCPTCQQHEFEFLNQNLVSQTVNLCGRNSIQIHPLQKQNLPLADLANQLAKVGQIIAQNEYLIRFSIDSYEITLFLNGRAIIKGTENEAIARSLYARYIGN
ncbi:ThiF family adenylyltransferase [Anaerolineales bacterium HSG24]|nr:ThiF family adenylyltransferase [Anaerolineales bacterium HSG24]